MNDGNDKCDWDGDAESYQEWDKSIPFLLFWVVKSLSLIINSWRAQSTNLANSFQEKKWRGQQR